MKTLYKLIFSAMILAVLFSCSKLDDFLDKAPESDQSYVSTISDCDLLLNNGDLICGAFNVVYQDDGIAFSDVTGIFEASSADYRAYAYWSNPKYLYEPTEDDEGWSTLYKNIYTCNVVLNYIDDVTGDDETLRNQLKGEAYFGRAFYHFMLVNMYAKQYDSSTASSDAGVPYVMDIDASAVRSRASVQTVYDNILSDLENALKYLKTSIPAEKKNFRGNIAAANAFLARVYLHLRDWKNAEKYARASLTITSFLYNYNDYSQYSADENDETVQSYKESEAYGSMTNRETTYLRSSFTSMVALNYFMSIDLGALMGGLVLTDNVTNILKTGDKRVDLFFGEDLFASSMTISKVKNYDIGFYGLGNVGTTVPETYLILAEAQARQGNTSGACATLDEFRVKRYDPILYKKFESSDKSEVITEITNEKTVEFVYSGNRWFEMRRLNSLGEFNREVVRYNGSGKEIGRLVPSSTRVVLPIGGKITGINPNITQNPFE